MGGAVSLQRQRSVLGSLFLVCLYPPGGGNVLGDSMAGSHLGGRERAAVSGATHHLSPVVVAPKW